MARSLGISHKRAFLGWTPRQIITATPEGGWQAVETSEWEANEIGLMVALDAIEQETCSGCGGDLTLELTDKAPEVDDGDGHFHRVSDLWCRKCRSLALGRQQRDKAEEKLRGTQIDPALGRILVAERLPVPTTT